MTGAVEGLTPAFRKWSILAFLAECTVVILAFLFMIYLLRWKINETMLYLLLAVMAVSAALLLLSGRAAAKE